MNVEQAKKWAKENKVPIITFVVGLILGAAIF